MHDDEIKKLRIEKKKKGSQSGRGQPRPFHHRLTVAASIPLSSVLTLTHCELTGWRMRLNICSLPQDCWLQAHLTLPLLLLSRFLPFSCKFQKWCRSICVTFSTICAFLLLVLHLKSPHCSLWVSVSFYLAQTCFSAPVRSFCFGCERCSLQEMIQ